MRGQPFKFRSLLFFPQQFFTLCLSTFKSNGFDFGSQAVPEVPSPYIAVGLSLAQVKVAAAVFPYFPRHGVCYIPQKPRLPTALVLTILLEAMADTKRKYA